MPVVLVVGVLAAGVALAIAGYLGPDDGGTLELAGLTLIAISVWKGLFN